MTNNQRKILSWLLIMFGGGALGYAGVDAVKHPIVFFTIVALIYCSGRVMPKS